jgi:hypothetical protein
VPMLDPAEEARAAEYRRKMLARAEWEYEQRFIAHPSSVTARAQLLSDWGPIIDKVRDWDPEADALESGKGLQIP